MATLTVTATATDTDIATSVGSHRHHDHDHDDTRDQNHDILLSSALPPPHTSASSHRGILSLPLRIVQWGIRQLLRLRAALPDSLRPWFWVGLWLFFAIIGIGLFAGFHTKIFQLLDQVAILIKGLGHAGPPLIMIGMFLTAFPPVLGYSSFVTMSGYVYGFTYGFLIAYTSALLGSVTCFYLGRKYFKKQVRTLMAKKQSMKSVVKAVEKRGFKLLLLIRLAPYPFNILNLALSATHIPLRTFALATALSLTKLTLHVYIGSTLSSLAPTPVPPPTQPTNGDPTTEPPPGSGTGTIPPPHGRNNLKIAVMVFSMLLGIAVSAHVWIVAKREIEASEGIRIERRRKRRQSRSSLGRGTSSALSSPRHHRGVAGLTTPTQDYFPSIDLTSHSTSDFVGGGYLDDEDDQEDQALFQHRRSGEQRRSYEDEGGSGSDSDGSDFLDDEELEEDMDDMERGDDGFLDNGSSWSNSGSVMEMRAHTTTTTLSTPLSCGSSPHPALGEQERIGWFAQNGVDISDRNW
ncbi:MAG: snare associated Golgi protein-domain-containing protein [Podila humilis]|nr:MAG: snare associated Golgi protein-domain-containing protein [Podila humilis]